MIPYFVFQFFFRMDKSDLWLVGDVNDFLCYKCPECNETVKEKEQFLQHALEIHPYTSRNLFSMNLNESIANEEDINSVQDDLETDQEYFDSVVEDGNQFIHESEITNLDENYPGDPGTMIKNELFDDVITVNFEENIVARKESKVENETLEKTSSNPAYDQFMEEMSKEKSSAYYQFVEEMAKQKSSIHNYKHHLLQDHEYTKFDFDFSITCEKCLKTFANASSLESHHHSHRRCELCGMKFAGQKSKDKYERHVKRHLRVKKVRKHKKSDKCVKDSTGQKRYKSIVVTDY